MRRTLSTPADRWRSAALASAMNLVLGYAIVVGLGVHNIPRPDQALKLFNLSDQPPPPPPIVPPPPEKARQETHKPKDPEGAAAPPAKKNTPSEIVAPKAKLPPPPPIQAAPVAGQGTAPKSGAATIDGPGTGRGGIGNGTGSGLAGNGSGGGGGGAESDPEQVAGSIGNEDYPRAALVDRAHGTVEFSFTVLPDGRIAGCRVTRSSGSTALDSTTCRLALQRFRFRPARDTSGRAIASEVEGEQEWRLGREIETVDPSPR
jgi:protein TonB